MIRSQNRSSSSGVGQIRVKQEEEEETGMVRFFLDNDGEGTSSNAVRKRRRTLVGSFSCCNAARERNSLEVVEEEEEEELFDVHDEEEAEEVVEEEVEEDEDEESEDDEEPDRDLEGSRGNGSGSGSVPVPGFVRLSDPDREDEGLRGSGSISVTLSDPDVLDCPICLDPLSVPVFQCENGHIACSSCCTKISNKCPSCCWPIGYNRCRAIEKVLESVKVPCTNKRFGCREATSYSNKADHEKACTYTPLLCPARACDFVGTAKEVYAHFSDKHSSLRKQICLNFVHQVYIEKHQTYQILQERREGIIFIINHTNERLGSCFNVICVRPISEKRRFYYELEASDGDTTYKLESFVESQPGWSENSSLRKFLMVPKDDAVSSAHLMLRVRIEQR